jgi:hypothetical protein
MRQFWCVILISMFLVVTGDRGWSSDSAPETLSSLEVSHRSVGIAAETVEVAQLQSSSSELPVGDEGRPGMDVGLATRNSIEPLADARGRERPSRDRSVRPVTLQAEQMRLQI